MSITPRFITISPDNFDNSIYVPQSNGVRATRKNVSDVDTECWYVDSRSSWTSLNGSFADVTADDRFVFAFWAKYDSSPQTFMLEIMHSDYEKRITYQLSSASAFCKGRKNGYKLFVVEHTARESAPITAGLSINGCEMTVIPASESDLDLFADAVREKGMISKIHPVINLMKGENYGFCGCMAYLADCLGMDGSVFDFHYFAMATGDIFTQVHRDSLTDCTDCVSDFLFANDVIYKAYCAIGYLYTFLDKNMVDSDKDAAMQKIRDSIDNNIPVISAGFEGDMGYDFCIICGYTDDGALKIMFKENEEPAIQTNLLDFTRGLIFTGEYRHDINLRQQFANVTRSIYTCVTRKPERECTFGADAFRAWADSLVNGGIANLDRTDSWCSYAYNLCIAGTNGFAGTPMLRYILTVCPEFEQTKAYSVLKKVCEQFDRQDRLFNELMQMGYGFDLSDSQLRDVDFLRPAAEKILEFCDVCEKIADAYDGILDNDDFWCTDDYRIVECVKLPFVKCRFVGICYKQSDAVNGMFSCYWGKWFEEGRFDTLEKLLTDDFISSCPQARDYIGLCRTDGGNNFEYWIGMFLPPECVVPDGYSYIDLDFEATGVCRIKGREQYLFCHEAECMGKLTKNGMNLVGGSDGSQYSFEGYNCPRFTAPDEYGEVILDMGFFVEKESKVKDLGQLKATAAGEQDTIEYFNLPDARVIGLSMRCPLDMREANPIPAFWGKCAADGIFDTVGKLPKLISGMLGFTDDYDASTNTFLYICGVMCPKGTPVPEGYTYRDIPAVTVCKSRYGDWMDQCKAAWEADGYEWNGDKGQCWNSELYIDGEDNDRGFRLLCAVKKI